MAYSLHIVPRKRTTEVLLSLTHAGGLGAPVNQRIFPSWAKMLQEIGPYLEENERRSAKASLVAGRTCWLPEVRLTAHDINRLGF